MTYVKKGAILLCTGCPGVPARLDTKESRTVKLAGDIVGVSTDKNIEEPGFVTCLVVPTAPRKCNPKLGPWTRLKTDVKSKGKPQLLFPNTIPCTFGPGLISMTFAGQVVNREGATEGKVGNKKCKWKDCDSKHEFTITYPNNGIVVRKGLRDWSHPSAMITFDIHKPAFKKGTVAPAYPFQRHHIIPCAVFKELPKISHNLKLLGFDINNEGLNGISLPTKPKDIVWHDLQYHRGYHKTYNDNVKLALKDLEKTMVADFCKKEEQIKMWEEIAKEVKDYKTRILKWEIPLYPDSFQKRAAGFKKIGIDVSL